MFQAVRKALARLFRRTVPDERQSENWLRPYSQAGEFVTEDTALTLSAYYACLRVLSVAIGQLPWRIREVGTKRLATELPAYKLLDSEPNGETDPAPWKMNTVMRYTSNGNSYHEIERDRAQRPVALWPLDPDRVTPFRDGSELWYRVQNRTQPDTYLRKADMLHFRNLGDELEGWSLLRLACNTIGHGLAENRSAANTLAKGAKLSGVLSPAGKATIPEKDAVAFRDAFKQQYQGAKNHGEVFFANFGLEFSSFSLPPADLQLLEGRQFTVLDVCRFTGVPPHLVYELTNATFSNIEHQGLEFLAYSLNIIVAVLQQQADRKLIRQPARYKSQIATQALLRSDSASRAAFFTSLFNMSAINADEIRDFEDLPPLPGGDGKTYYRPLNMQPVDEPLGRPDGRNQTQPEPPPADDNGQASGELPERIRGNGRAAPG